MNIAQYIEYGLERYPHEIAVVFEGTTYTYENLAHMAAQVANGLRGLGIRSGDRVALFLPNIPEFITAYLGIQKIGAIAVSLNAMSVQAEVAFILNDCSARVLITSAALLENVPSDLPHLEHILTAEGEAEGCCSLAEMMAAASIEAPAVDMDRDDPAAIVYSSGTTGVPKGVTLSHGNVISNIQAKKKYCGMGPAERAILFVPMFHCFGQNAVMNAVLNAGGTLVLHRKFSIDAVLESIISEQVTMFFAVPTVFILLLNRATPADFAPVRYFFSAAATLPAEIAQRWQERFGIVINEGYGLTESSPFACYNHIDNYQLGSLGTPIDDVEMKIVDPDSDDEVAPGALGEIVIRGPNVMLGYWNQPEATAETMRNGWLHTGDIGRMDEDGYFYIVDRLKDMVNVSGMKVYPAEVENVIYQHSAVAEAAVYGAPDPITEERVEAAIVLKNGHDAPKREILALCREQMASFKVPTEIVFVDSLPKSATGKILKRVLRETTLSGNGYSNG